MVDDLEDVKTTDYRDRSKLQVNRPQVSWFVLSVLQIKLNKGSLTISLLKVNV